MAKAKKQTKLKIWWIVILVVFVALFALYGLFKNTTPQPKESSRYQTYQNSEFGFSIEYPQNWKIKKDTQVFENGDAVAFQIKGPTQKRYTEFIDGARFIVSKPFYINTDLEIWVKDYFKDSVKFSKSTLTKYTYEEVEDCTNFGCMRYFFTTINNKVYGVALFADGSSKEKAMYENALIYMFKSLKFAGVKNEDVSKEEAILKVKALPEVIDYLKRVPNGLVLINGEEDNAYMVQVYEFKNDHTATFNWYKVDKTTGKVKKEF